MPNFIQQIERLEQLRQSLIKLDSAGSNNFADARVAVIEALQSLGVDNLNDLVNPKTAETNKLGQPVSRGNIVLPTTAAKRRDTNEAAMDLLDRINAEGLTRDDLTSEEIETLAQFTGFGGGIKNKRTNQVGSQYEYYTPVEVAAGMWDLAADLGFKGGKVLDPSAGTGIFAGTSPDSVVIDNIELDETSGGIAKALNDGDRSHTTISPFEAEAGRIPDNSLDMVITNVPFGSNASRGENKFKDKAYQNETLEAYFILRSLEKIRGGGLAMFITPANVISGRKTDKERLRLKTSLKAEFLGAYRLPNAVFEQTGADVVTDVIVYRKHSDEAVDKINDLYNAGDTQTLKDAGVLWDSYLSGQYFKKEGKRYILGDVEIGKNKFGGEVERVVSKDLTPNIAKKLRKFDDDSRIDWAMLDAAEPEIIEYKDGDTIFQNGKQLKFADGAWIEVEREVTDTELEIQDLLAKIGDSNSIVANNIGYADIERITQYAQDTGQRDLIPQSVEKLISKAQEGSNGTSLAAAWDCVVLADVIDKLFNEHGYSGYDYYNNEKIVTDRIKDVYAIGKSSKFTGAVTQAYKLIALHYNKGKYSEAWLGNINNEVDTSQNADHYKNKMARFQYENKSLYLTPDQLKEIHPDVDPLHDDEWFVTADGQNIINANDFLVGTLADRLKDIDEHISKATDDKIKDKLIRQKTLARQAAPKTDFSKLQYDLRSPLIDAETKVKFLKQFVSTDAVVVYDEYGRGTADIQGKSGKNVSDEDKLLNRFGDWLSKGTVTLGGTKLNNMSDREALEWLSNTINKANVNFNSWVKADKNLINTLDKKGNTDENLYFVQNADDSPIDIAGLNPKLNLHGYQNEFVRKQGRFFGGINGMGVGLGKTFSALASVQHVHNIGAKKKTLFIVPNSVLSNWRKEAQFAYQSSDDCIFVGLREKGDEFRVHSSKYDEDLLKAIDSKYRKVFLTYEAFRRIRLKDSTIENYAEYLRDTDSAYEDKELKKEGDKAEGLVAELIENIKIESSAPYLEDMGVDSIVIDEAHAFKNSITAPKTNAQVKYLSLPQTSTRGEDAQAKLFYIRGLTTNNDGVQLLSATPITNSPLEVYSMLSLASGRKAVNSMAAGVKGADEFLQLMCEIQEEVVPTIDGGERSQNVFTGIRNVQVLRRAIGSTATIKDAKSVGMSVVIPERDEQATKVQLTKESKDLLELYQKAYKIARELTKDNPDLPLPQDPEHPDNPNSSYQQVKRIFNEPDRLMGHPFNLINKMDILIADDDFSKQASFYDFDQNQRALAEKVVEEFNKKPANDERDRLSVFTDPDDAAKIYVKDGDKKVLAGYKIKVKSKLVIDQGRERIVIDTLNAKQQDRFEKIAEKHKLKLDVTVSAKVAAMLDNFKNEMAHPRGSRSDGSTSSVVKQIIFCDHLFLHNKIKRLLVDRAGVKADKIVIITGQTNNEPDQMIDIQDGFNAMDDENRYQVVIANQKAEVGINLQKGTQAIHHLTTGWTPDSLEQRNGRGARQGNMTDKVTIYHYDADGTFDEFKRTMINKKDEWISSVLSDDDRTTVAVSGGISRAEQEALIEFGSDKDAIARYQAEKEAKEVEERRSTAKNRQNINMETILNQQEMLKKLSPSSFLYSDVLTVVETIRANANNLKKSKDKKVKAATRENYSKKYEQNKKIALDKLSEILPSITISGKKKDGFSVESFEDEGVSLTPEQVYQNIEDNLKEFAPSKKNGEGWGTWVHSFKDMLLEDDGPNYVSSYKVKEGTSYTEEYEIAKEAAENLIEQAGHSIDEISKEYGGYPVGAGQLLAQGKATVKYGQYYEEGYIAVKPGSDKLVVVAEDLRFYLLNDNEDSSYYGQTEEHYFYPRSDDKIIGPDDPEYISYLKKMAAIEDQLKAAGLLEDPLYSRIIPAVAEYRNDDVVATYLIQKAITSSKHYLLVNSSLPFVLPVGVISNNTSAGRALQKTYESDGIVFDFANSRFKIDANSKLEVNGRYEVSYRVGHTSHQPIIDYFIDNNIELEGEDKMLLDYEPLVTALFTNKSSELIKKVTDYINQVVKSGNVIRSGRHDTYIEALRMTYNKHLSDDVYANALIENHRLSISGVIGLLLNKNTTTGKLISGIEYIKELERVHNQEKSTDLRGDKSEESGIDGSTKMLISGQTKEWEDQIKDYASRYGSKVRGNRKYFWDSRRTVWIISYSAFEKLIADYPRAKQDLQAEKEV